MYGIWINENVWYLKYYNMFKLAVLIVLILELYIYLLISKECARLLILVPHDFFTIYICCSNSLKSSEVRTTGQTWHCYCVLYWNVMRMIHLFVPLSFRVLACIYFSCFVFECVFGENVVSVFCGRRSFCRHCWILIGYIKGSLVFKGYTPEMLDRAYE